jgi:hypothetical protein
MKITKTSFQPFYYDIIADTLTEDKLLKILCKKTSEGNKIYFSRVGNGEITIKIK